jgi:hypothetical protein
VYVNSVFFSTGFFSSTTTSLTPSGWKMDSTGYRLHVVLLLCHVCLLLWNRAQCRPAIGREGMSECRHRTD